MADTLKIRAKGQTHVGRVRSSNQDSLLVNERLGLFIVADGMGGHAGGEIASKLCITQVSDYIRKEMETWPPDLPFQHPDGRINSIMMDAINYASAKIYEHALEDPALRGMGTTATVMKIIDRRAYAGHVGDSRLYLIRAGFMYQLTFDHSLVNEQLRAGILTEEEAEHHHLKNVITRSVGYLEEEDVDTASVEIEPGDLFLLCSDGLTRMVNDKEISTIAQQYRLEAVERFINLANERGGEDNITVIMLDIG